MKTIFHRIKFILVVLLISFPFSIDASLIGGIVRSADNEPVDDVAVSLFQLPDSVFVNLTLSDAEGSFSFNTEFLDSTYYLTFSHDNYIDLTLPVKSELTEAWMQPAASELLEVTVTGFRQRMKTIPGGFEYDPKDLIKNSMDFASVVAKVPMVEYKDGVASILGKGKSELYLNGRPIIADPELVAMTFKS